MTEPVELPPQYVYPDGQEPPEAVSLPQPATNDGQPLPSDLASQRAAKTAIGLGGVLGKTATDLQPDFQEGKESQIRQDAAAQLDLQRQRDKVEQIRQMSKKYGPLSSQQIGQFMDPFAPENQNADPDTVIEKQYAHSYIGTLATAPGFLATENVMDVAAREIPKQASDTIDLANDLVTKNQYILKKLQDAQQLVSQQSWFGWGVDQAKNVTQLYPEAKQRGLVDGIYGGGLLGSNLQDQSNALYRKPFSEFKKTVDDIAAKQMADNPALAVSTLDALHGQDTFEASLNNIMSGMALPDMALGASVLKKVLTFNQVRKAARDIVSATAKDIEPTKATMTAAAGDVGESAVQQVAQQVMQTIAGSSEPLKALHTTLITPWKEMVEKFQSNPGTYLSREETTRILDGFVTDGQALLNKIQVMNRVERNPQALTEDVVRAYKDSLRNKFKGPDATVVDVQGPIIEPISNTKWFKVMRGDYDGSLFADRETPKGRAEGEGHFVAGEEPEKVYLSPTAAKNIESIKTVNGATKFYVDKDIEVQASTKAEPGFIPYNLKTNKFEPALTAERTSVEQQGLGFYIEHWVPMQETNNILRDTMIRDTKGNLVPDAISHSSATGTKSIINSVLGWVRNSDETLAVNESIQRKAVVYSQSNIHKWAADLNKDINKIQNKGSWWKPTAYIGKVTGKEVRDQFERALNYARQEQRWFKGPGELQDFYMRNFHRDPSPLETRAYFNYVKLIEGDRMLGEVAEFRNRARVGAEQHSIRLIGPDGKPVLSSFFDGVALRVLPNNTDQILIVGDKPGEDTVKATSSLGIKAHKTLNELVQTGRGKLIEVYDLDHYPLNDFSDATKGQRIRYVFSRSIESRPIAFNHVNKLEGGHFDWDYDHFIKQADMRHQASGVHIYVGDKTIMPVGNKALGGNIVKMWNEAQKLIVEGKWDEVRPIVAKMGIKYEDFTGWYKAGRDEAGKPIGPKLDPHEPIYVVPKGKNILSLDSSLQERYRVFDKKTDKYRSTFEDGSRTGFANNFKVAYNTERHTDFNFKTINDIGTKENPIYAYQPAKLVDPLPTMNRALNRAINSAFMDDYKLYAIEHWLREAEAHLDVEGGIDAVRSAPFWHFNNPKFKSSTPANIKWNLQSHQYKINSFVGIPSKFDTWVHTFTEHLASEAYAKYGPEESRNIYEKGKTIVPIWLLHRVTNPVDFIRGATFNFKLGLFNPAQFLVQAQTHALIWSLEPQHGTAGTYAMMLHGWSRVNQNPAILKALDNYATKLSGFGSRFKPGEFLEGMRELDKTGFEHVAGEYANLSKAYSPTTNFLKGDIEQGLKIGQTPFRLGEQSTRVTAWYTAFRKFREENPTVAIGNIERGKILNHADLLTVNMSRASSSMLNHGVFSMSTQFLNYQIKLAELFWSKRLGETPASRAMARARIITGFSMLYGIPNAIGVTGAPFSDNVRAHLIDDLGYIPGEKWVSTLLNEGFPAWSMAMISGKGDLQAGNVENVGNRYGSQGWQNIKQGLRSDIPWYMAIGGAGITTMSKFMSAALDPFYQGVVSWANGAPGDQRFTIKSADLVEPLKQISTVSQGAKWWTAMQTGQWINNNEQYQTDVSPLRASLLAMNGMNPQAQDDAFAKGQIVKGEQDAQKKALTEFEKDWVRSVKAFQNNDPEQGNAFVNNGMARFAAVGYPPEEILKAMARASKGLEPAINNADYTFWTQGDRNKMQQRQDMFIRNLELNEKRK